MRLADELVMHDCSTLGGNSGSPVVNALVRKSWPQVADRLTPISSSQDHSAGSSCSLRGSNRQNAAVEKSSDVAEKCTTTARASIPFKRLSPIIARATKSETLRAITKAAWL